MNRTSLLLRDRPDHVRSSSPSCPADLPPGAFAGVWSGREHRPQCPAQLVRNTPPSEVSQEGKTRELILDKTTRRRRVTRRAGRSRRPPPGQHPARDLGGRAEVRIPPRRPPSRAAEEPATIPPAINGAERRNRRRAAPRGGTAAAAEAAKAAEARRRPRRPRQAAASANSVSRAARDPTTTNTKTPRRPRSQRGLCEPVFSRPTDPGRAHPRPADGGGQKAYLSPINRGGSPMYRVRIGPQSHDDAQKGATRAQGDNWIRG